MLQNLVSPTITIWILVLIIGSAYLYYKAPPPKMASETLQPIIAFALIWTLTVPLIGWYPGGKYLGLSGRPIAGDWAAFYTAGKMAFDGLLNQAYPIEPYQAYYKQIFGKLHGFTWQYPPTATLFLGPLTQLGFYIGAIIWTLGPPLLFAIAIPKKENRPQYWLLLVSYPALWLNLHFGQTGVLFAAAYLWAFRSFPNKPIAAGIIVGLMTIKPQISVMVPLFLMTTGSWRTFISATITTLILILASAIIFGLDSWTIWFKTMTTATERLGGILPAGPFTSWFALVKNTTNNDLAATIAQTASFFFAAVVTFLICRNPRLSIRTKAGFTIIASLMASPYIMVYDWAIIASAYILLAGDLATHTRTSKICLSLIWAFPILLGAAWHIKNPYAHIGAIYITLTVGYLFYALQNKRGKEISSEYGTTNSNGIARLAGWREDRP